MQGSYKYREYGNPKLSCCSTNNIKCKEPVPKKSQNAQAMPCQDVYEKIFAINTIMSNLNLFIDSILLEKCTAGNTENNCCKNNNIKCKEGQGDCSYNSDCEEGLKCGDENCGDNFPDPWYRCCYKP